MVKEREVKIMTEENSYLKPIWILRWSMKGILISPPVLVGHEHWTSLWFSLEHKSMRSNMTNNFRYEGLEPLLPVKHQELQTDSVLVILGKCICGKRDEVFENRCSPFPVSPLDNWEFLILKFMSMSWRKKREIYLLEPINLNKQWTESKIVLVLWILICIISL